MNSTTYDEPSWMSRVKRAQNREDIVVNRDDGDDPASLAEKGAGNAANGDLGMLAMFGAGSESKEESPSSGSGGSETAGSSEKEEIREEKRGREKRETEHELEMDDDPPKNILADYDTNADEGDEQHEKGDGHKADRTRLKAEGAPIGKIRSRDSAKDARYCAPNQTQTWQEGRKVRSLIACRSLFMMLGLLTPRPPLSRRSSLIATMVKTSKLSTSMPHPKMLDTPTLILDERSSRSLNTSFIARCHSTIKEIQLLKNMKSRRFIELLRDG